MIMKDYYIRIFIDSLFRILENFRTKENIVLAKIEIIGPAKR